MPTTTHNSTVDSAEFERAGRADVMSIHHFAYPKVVPLPRPGYALHG